MLLALSSLMETKLTPSARGWIRVSFLVCALLLAVSESAEAGIFLRRDKEGRILRPRFRVTTGRDGYARIARRGDRAAKRRGLASPTNPAPSAPQVPDTQAQMTAAAPVQMPLPVNRSVSMDNKGAHTSVSPPSALPAYSSRPVVPWF